MYGPSDSLKMRWQSDADTICFQCESGAGGSVKDGSAKRMIKEAEKAPTMVDAMKDLRKDVNLDCSEMSMQARRLSEIENQNHAPPRRALARRWPSRCAATRVRTTTRFKTRTARPRKMWHQRSTWSC